MKAAGGKVNKVLDSLRAPARSGKIRFSILDRTVKME